MSDHIKRITIDLDGDATAQEALDILTEVAGKLGQCWADTTSGPIYDWTGKHTANAKVEKLPFDLQIAVHETDRRDAAIRHDERKRIIAEGCIHTRKRDERASQRPDLDAWQATQGEWFDPTMLEIVTEYAEWRDAQGAEVSDDDIIVLYQQGKKLDDIAQATGLPKSTVHARLKRHGLTQARRRIKWTANMRNELIGLRAIKAPMSTIAKRFKVSRSAVYAELARIERR